MRLKADDVDAGFAMFHPLECWLDLLRRRKINERRSLLPRGVDYGQFFGAVTSSSRDRLQYKSDQWKNSVGLMKVSEAKATIKNLASPMAQKTGRPFCLMIKPVRWPRKGMKVQLRFQVHRAQAITFSRKLLNKFQRRYRISCIVYMPGGVEADCTCT